MPATLQPFARSAIGANGYTVYECDPEKFRNEIDMQKVLPVYALGPDGPFSVATGRVFIRFADGIRVSDKAEIISGAGYRVVEVLSYAPQAAWLAASDRTIASALSNLPRLAGLGDLDSVEPQLVMESVPRR